MPKAEPGDWKLKDKTLKKLKISNKKKRQTAFPGQKCTYYGSRFV